MGAEQLNYSRSTRGILKTTNCLMEFIHAPQSTVVIIDLTADGRL